MILSVSELFYRSTPHILHRPPTSTSLDDDLSRSKFDFFVHYKLWTQIWNILCLQKTSWILEKLSQTKRSLGINRVDIGARLPSLNDLNERPPVQMENPAP